MIRPRMVFAGQYRQWLDMADNRASMRGRSRARSEVWVRRNFWHNLLLIVVLLALPTTAMAARHKTKAKPTAQKAPAMDAKPDAKADGKPEAKPETKGPVDADAEYGPSVEAQDGPAYEPVESGTPVGEDALRLGPFVAPPKPFPFPLLGDDRQKEVFVDREGKLYKDRPYSGQVPDWNSEVPSNTTGRCKVEPQMLTWVGFQNTADASRVYVQLEHEACGYVYRPDDSHIVIDLPQVAIANPNLRREILTGAFPTQIDFIRAEDVVGRGTRIVISLKDKRSYLSAHLGRYVFVDIPR